MYKPHYELKTKKKEKKNIFNLYICMMCSLTIIFKFLFFGITFLITVIKLSGIDKLEPFYFFQFKFHCSCVFSLMFIGFFVVDRCLDLFTNRSEVFVEAVVSCNYSCICFQSMVSRVQCFPQGQRTQILY